MIKHHLLASSQEVKKLLKQLRSDDIDLVSFDIETNGKDEHLCRVIGIAVAWDIEEGYYIVLAKYDDEKRQLVSLYDNETENQLVTELCSILSKKKLLMHNGVYDIACMYHSYKVNLTDALYADTILMKHTVHEERPFGLKEISEILFGEEAKDEQKDLADNVKAKGGKWTKKQKDIYMGDTELIGKYAVKDVILTAMVYNDLEEELNKQKLSGFFYDREVMPLYRKATIPMKLKGLFVDVSYFEKLKKEVEDGILSLTDEVFELLKDDIEEKVREILDKSVSTSRTGQFAEKLLHYYDMPVPSNKKTGKPTLAKSALRLLLTDYPDHVALQWLLWEHPQITIQEEVEVPKTDETGTTLLDEQGKPICETVNRLRKVDDPNVECPYKIPDKVIYEVKKQIYVERNPGLPHVFNLSSTHHLSWLLFEKYKEKPKNFSRRTGKPKVDKDSLHEYEHLNFMKALAKLKKEEKLLSTYLIPILEKQTKGWLYPSLQQWGTTSGRYSCGGGLNLQTLPRDDKRIKKGFIAPPGYKVVNADFSALEPRIFAWVSGDPGLKRVYWDGLDLYSQIAIDVLGLEGVSALESDDNYLKKINPDARQQAKVFTLAVPYGANAMRIAPMLGVEPNEAQEIIDAYLGAYPGLRDYMERQEQDARENGFVYTEFGRIRHLDEAADLWQEHGEDILNKMVMALKFAGSRGMRLYDEYCFYRKKRDKKSQEMKKKLKDAIYKLGFEGVSLYSTFRNLMNNSKNFPIQATAAHVTNASLIMLADLFEEHDIDGWVCLQVHDEITCIVAEHDVERAAKLLKMSMEENWVAKKIDIPMIAEPMVADNFAEAK